MLTRSQTLHQTYAIAQWRTALTRKDSGDDFPTIQTMIKAAILTATIAVLGVSQVAIAQNAERYKFLGNDNRGNAMFLDMPSVRGARFKILKELGQEELAEISMTVACGGGKLTVGRIVAFDRSGRVVAEDNGEKVMSAPIPPMVNAMKVVCKSINASGW